MENYRAKKKAARDAMVQRVWDGKTNSYVRIAFEDANGWIANSKGIFACDVLDNIAADCQMRLDVYILPQMKKRGMS